MSEQEYHKGKLKKVDLSEYDNDIEKYFEVRYRYDFAANEDRPNGMTEEEIQEAYQRSLEYKYRTRGAWEDLWFDNTDDYDQLIKVNDELWEVAVWNAHYEVWDDSEGDEYMCDKDNVTHWMRIKA